MSVYNSAEILAYFFRQNADFGQADQAGEVHDKLQVHSRSEAVAKALRDRLIK